MMHILVGLLLAAQGGAPATDAQCVIDQIPAADRTALRESALRGDETLGAPAERLNGSTRACAERFHWSRDQAGRAAALALSVVFVEESSPLLTRVGIPPERIDRWLAGQSDSVRTSPEISQETMESLIRHLQGTGLDLAMIEANGRLIGVYLGGRVMIERIARGLPMQ
jgi:hypothetical protein